MSFSREIGIIVAFILSLGSIVFGIGLLSGAIRIMNGDASAVGDMLNATTNEVVDSLQWSAGLSVVTAFAGALGLTSLVAWLKRYCD
jgi:hypothetical protein